MSATFVILFWGCLAGVCGLFWLSFLVLFIAGRRLKSQPLSLLGGIPLWLSTGFAILGLGWMGYGVYSSSRPANVYEMTFGSPPSPDVQNLRSSYYYFADTGLTYLRFNAAPSTIKRLTAKGWTRLPANKVDEIRGSLDADATNSSDDTPPWWKQRITDTTIMYSADRRVKDFASENETLTYDTATHEAYYDFQGVD